MKKGVSFFLGVGLLLPSLAAIPSLNVYAETEGEGCFSYNDTLYAAFSEARNAMGDEGGTVKLVCDAAVEDTIYGVAKSVVFDLNGHTYTQTTTSDRDAFRVSEGGVLTIEDSSEAKTGEIKGDYAVIYVLEKGKLIVNGGAIRANSFGAISWGGEIEMNGGEIRSDSTGVDIDDGATLTVNDGEIHGRWGVTVFNDSEIVMNGGSIRATEIGVSGNGTADSTKNTPRQMSKSKTPITSSLTKKTS